MTAERIVSAARAQIGVKESPANSNRVKYNTAYYGREVSGNNYPWCCAFIWWVFHSVGADKLFFGGKKTAYCPAVETYYRKKGQWHKEPERGDLALFDFSGKGVASHIGIVESVNSDGSITTVEGNTALSDDDNGGAVMLRFRKRSTVRGFARPAYEDKDGTVDNLLADGIITADNAANWRAFLSGTATPKPEYIRTLLDRYHKKLRG